MSHSMNSTNEQLTADQVCYIDEETSRTLELLNNEMDSANRRDTLLGYLNKTCTTAGYRMLRHEIVQPLAHVHTLERRLDCIEHFLNRRDCHALLIRELNFFGRGVDIDRLVANLATLATHKSNTLRMAEKRLDILLSLHSIIARVPNLMIALHGVDHPVVNAYKDSLDDAEFERIQNDIVNVIDFNDSDFPKTKRNRVLSIKPGVNKLFDLARDTYRDAIHNLEVYVHELQIEDHLPWRLTYVDSKGYLLSLSKEKVAGNITLPSKYIRVVKTRSTITCSTIDMMRSNVRANVSYENSMKLANELLVNLLENILGNVGSINKLVEVVGRLDLISSLAKLAGEKADSLVRPKFSNMETIIEDSKHPILEKILELNEQEIVPNDIFLSANRGNLCLITGPNMGGKSIYLKQVALIQIMAQIGSFVPARRAVIKPVNRIAVRVGVTDDGRSSCSSFMAEMKGIATALLGFTEFSCLYIVDEVGRGTSIEDGTAYSLAIAEELAMRKNSFTIFSTHFPVLFTLPALVNNVKIYQFKIEVDNQQKNNLLTHKLVPGFAEKCHYGIELAESCNLPHEILSEARRILGIQ